MIWLNKKHTLKKEVYSMQFDEFLKEQSAKIVQTVEKDNNALVVLGPWSGPVDTEEALNALTAGAKANGALYRAVSKTRTIPFWPLHRWTQLRTSGKRYLPPSKRKLASIILRTIFVPSAFLKILSRTSR